MDWAPERPLTGIKYSYTAKTFFNVALTLPYLSLFLDFPLSLIVPPRRKSRRWPTSQPHLFIQCRLRTGHLRLTAAISACWLANMIAQRTVGKLWVNPYLSKREPPGTNSQRTKPSTSLVSGCSSLTCGHLHSTTGGHENPVRDKQNNRYTKSQ